MLIIQTYIKELKYLIWYILISITLTTTVIYTYNYETLYIISKPLLATSSSNFDFIFTNVFEAFKTYLFLSIVMALSLNLPFIIWIIALFLIKGLYKTEAKQLYCIIVFFSIFLIIINWLFYSYIYPLITTFLLQYENSNIFLPLNINIQLKLNEYFSVFFKLIYSYNLILTLPWILLFINNNKWIYYKKYIYIINLILVALITPPDVISLLLFVIPTFCILEVTHILKKIKY